MGPVGGLAGVELNMSNRQQQAYTGARRSDLPAWLWLLDRFAGLLILGLVMTHMIINHFVEPGTVIDVGFVEANLRKASLLFVDSALLLTGLFHGLVGVRNVLFDFVTAERARSLIVWGCLLTGTVFFVFGLTVLVVVLGR